MLTKPRGDETNKFCENAKYKNNAWQKKEFLMCHHFLVLHSLFAQIPMGKSMNPFFNLSSYGLNNIVDWAL